MKIAIIFPPYNHKKFSENLEVVDEEYKDYFYKGIGSYIGLMFSHNLTRANEECDKLSNNNIYCSQRVHEYFNETTYS